MAIGFIERVNRHASLTDWERDVLGSLEELRVEARRGQTIASEGDRITDLYVLHFGWALCEYCAEDGRRQMTQVHLPGDVMGYCEMHRKRSSHRLVMKTDGSYGKIPLRRLAEVFTKASRLGTLFLSLAAEEQMAQSQQLHAQAKLSAQERLIVFLLSLRERLSFRGLGTVSRFHLPMTQVEIARYLGLTPVWVSRLFRELRESGQIEFDNQHIRIMDPDKLAEDVGFRSTRSEWNVDWFPPAQGRFDPGTLSTSATSTKAVKDTVRSDSG